MADDDLVTIATYGSPQDAHLSRSVLEGRGIRACVVDDATTGWLWYLGTAFGAAKLQVANRDVAQARDALRRAQPEDGPSGGGPWICPHCGAEVDGGFDVCWSCEGPMEELATSNESAESKVTDNLAFESADGQSAEDDVPSPAEANATRAFRSAVFGIVFPPLLVYAAYLVIKTMGQELRPAAKRRYFVALAICLVFTILWWHLLRRW